MKKDWKIYEIITIIIAILLFSFVICSFIGVISLTNKVIGILLFIFYFLIAIFTYRDSKLFSLMYLIVGIIIALCYMKEV
ncbi:hypothetical protein GCM10010896_15870 [Mammaliicoccus stepanovicii]|uniref:Uncharacterized protein n=1 Tax=Mammaliicoccus stepanovicii TaxID=643214 RepID=A0A239ZES7_9STAP|nr:hypothetical protein CD111_01275 [Mammaliicoccus stepanovicii]GGI41928.1 hypothetical protein GCM10010896_15870 [Mammaliicoccus stepanovicii]SNV69741.1 Uncharacterised protein [Mammaliicoccus stepanovicii]